jgi:hypothetical protein
VHKQDSGISSIMASESLQNVMLAVGERAIRMAMFTILERSIL